MSGPSEEPQGIVAIMTAPDGDVIATATDFDRSGMGGCKLWEAQMWRARDQVKWKAVRAYSSNVLCDALSGYLCSSIADALIAKGHKITCLAIGYPDDVAHEVKRK